jgi:general secretion pathway protein G
MKDSRMSMSGRNGITLIELLVVIAIVGILASAAMPLSRVTVKRTREMELRNNLRTIRTAIDAFRKDCLPGAPATTGTAGAGTKLSSDYCKSDQDYYPESLELLTEPLKLAGAVDKTRKYLRRIPRDPMMPPDSPDNPNNWGMRSYRDEPDSRDWGGGDVFDVFSKSEEVALDGSQYNTW